MLSSKVIGGRIDGIRFAIMLFPRTGRTYEKYVVEACGGYLQSVTGECLTLYIG